MTTLCNKHTILGHIGGTVEHLEEVPLDLPPIYFSARYV